MDKIEAIIKNYGEDVEINENTSPMTFKIDRKVYSIRDDAELERDAKRNIEEIFDEYSDEDLTKFVNDNGSFIDFYDEVFINDFRYEDPDTFNELSDEEIIDYLNEVDYFYDGYPKTALDMDKLVEYVWDADGAIGLSMYDGKETYCDGYTVIREE